MLLTINEIKKIEKTIISFRLKKVLNKDNNILKNQESNLENSVRNTQQHLSKRLLALIWFIFIFYYVFLLVNKLD